MSINKVKLAFTGVLVSGVAALTGLGSLALFTDSQTITGNAFTSGSIDIGLNPTSDLVSFSDMMPGDSITDDVVITNVGNSNELRYSITSVADDIDGFGLKDQLVMSVRKGDVGAVTQCTAKTGEQLYLGDFDSIDGSGKIVGDMADGQDAASGVVGASGSFGADRVLVTGVTGFETLCFTVSLPIETGDEFQNSATTATFTFSAEQTQNNP